MVKGLLTTLVKNLAYNLVVGSALTIPTYSDSINSYSEEPQTKKSSTVSPLESIATCIIFASNKSLDAIGAQGGYFETKPESKIDIGKIFIPIYYDKGKISMPETKDIEKELSSYVSSQFLVALKLHNKVRFIPEESKLETSAEINKDSVDFTYKLSLKISKDEKFATTFSMTPPKYSAKSKLFEMLEIARYITDSHKEDPEMIEITKLTQMARDRNLTVRSIEFKEQPNTSFYRISRHKKGESYMVLGSLSSKGDNNKNAEEDKSSHPESFQFFNRYKEKSKKTPDAPAPLPIAPKADPSAPSDQKEDSSPPLPIAPKADPSS